MRVRTAVTLVIWCATIARAGPYTDAGISGYVNPNNRFSPAKPGETAAVLNPIFRGWATGFKDYLPSDSKWTGAGVWNDPRKAIGPVTGDNFDIVSLGDLDRGEIERGVEPGRITLVFGDPCEPGDPNHIRNGRGYDFVVFENGLISAVTTPGGSVTGKMLAELAYVEVSSNGRDFVRFPSVSLTPKPVGPYGTIDISDVHNLAGKHPNGGGGCLGTAFDLSDIAEHPLVRDGAVDVNSICYVRIVDVPGSGDFSDEATEHISPETWPQWANYGVNHPIYDQWLTWGSGGFDLEAVGVLHEQRYEADVDLNGIVDWLDFALLARAWGSHFGAVNWVGRCDLGEPRDMVVDAADLAAFARQWLAVEEWRD